MNKIITKENIEKYIGQTVLFGSKISIEAGGKAKERVIEKVDKYTITLKNPKTGNTQYVDMAEEKGAGVDFGFSEVVFLEK